MNRALEPQAGRPRVRDSQSDNAGADEGEGARRLPGDGLEAAVVRGQRGQGHARHDDRRFRNWNNRYKPRNAENPAQVGYMGWAGLTLISL